MTGYHDYDVTLIDKHNKEYNKVVTAAMFTEALLKAMNLCSLANFDVKSCKIKRIGFIEV